MSDNKDKLLIGVVVGLFGIAGITTVIYFFNKRKDKKSHLIEEQQLELELENVETIKEPEQIKKENIQLNLTQKSQNEVPSQSTNISNSIRKNLEITTSVSLELSKKNDNLTINKDTIEFLSVIPEKAYKEKEYKEDDEDKLFPNIRHRGSEKTQQKKYLKDKETFFENNPTERLPTKLSNSHVSNSPSKSIGNNNQQNNFYDVSILNLNDFKDQIMKSQVFKDLNIDLSISLDRPILPADIQKVAGNERIFDSEGYIEEDDDDLKENFEEEILGGKQSSVLDEDNFDINLKTRRNVNMTGNKNINLEGTKIIQKILISTPEQLHEVLYGRHKNEDAKYSLTYDEKEIKFPNEETEISQILKPKIVLMILRYLYEELHSGLIELSDNFVEERRKYFTVDHETYVSIINYFLRKKEEFFLCVLSDVMSKLDISQKNLDKTFFYYMNIADSNGDEIIINIRQSYDKVYHAGVKYSIAPKFLTKTKLKIILTFQCEIYEKLMKESNNYEPDVIEIMVTDYVYLEYGFDREAIRAAILKHNIKEDPEFSEILRWLESIKNSSFLNI